MEKSGLDILNGIMEKAHGKPSLEYMQIENHGKNRKLSYNSENDRARICMSGEFPNGNGYELSEIPNPLEKKQILYDKEKIKNLSKKGFPVIKKEGYMANVILIDIEDGKRWVKKLDQEISENLSGIRPRYTLKDGFITYSFPDYNSMGEPIEEIHRESNGLEIEGAITNSPREAMEKMKKPGQIIRNTIKTENAMRENGENKIRKILAYWKNKGKLKK